jgi:hypothetical protein
VDVNPAALQLVYPSRTVADVIGRSIMQVLPGQLDLIAGDTDLAEMQLGQNYFEPVLSDLRDRSGHFTGRLDVSHLSWPTEVYPLQFELETVNAWSSEDDFHAAAAATASKHRQPGLQFTFERCAGCDGGQRLYDFAPAARCAYLFI